MRRTLVLLVLFLLLLASPPHGRAQSSDPSELFLNAYMSVQQAERLEHDGTAKQALAKYRYAASLLEQIQQRYPTWQPLIVEYRKKRTSENIARLEQGADGGGTVGVQTEPEPILPEKAPPSMAEQAPDNGGVSTPANSAGGELKGRIDQLQTELRESKTQLRNVQQEKERIASQLDETLKQLDKNKTGTAELKSRLQQAQESLKNAAADNSQDAQARQVMQRQIAQLQEQLADAQAEREAADEVSGDYARRMAKVRQSATVAATEREAATAKLKDLETKYADAAKATKQLEEAKNQISKLTQENETSRQSSDEISAKLADAQKQMASLAHDRDAARKETEDLTRKFTDAQQQIASVSSERDSMAKQRDQALSDLAKAREAQKHVDQLMTDNAALAQKLAEAESSIKQFKLDAPKKDEQIANLKKEVGETRQLLVATQKQNTEYKSSMADLQGQLDTANARMTAMQSSSATPEEKKKFNEENDLLRGIVIRQLKEQARREQAKKLVMTELQRLEVQSGTLLQQIDYLGQPVVKLTDQEKALFKQPQIEITESDSSSGLEFSIAAPKPDAKASASPEAKGETPQPASNTKAAAGATPAQVARLTNPGAPQSSPPAPAAGGSPADHAPQIETTATPNVPEALQAQAHDAKDFFDRGEYRDAEKIYEKMLSQAPNNVYVLSNLGVVDFRQNKMKLAEERFRKAIAIAPADAFSQRTLGIVYYQQAKYDEAVNALTKAIALSPKDAISHNYLGITASQKGWQEAALKELQTSIALDANYADANFNLAVIYATMQPPNKEAAQRYYKRAIALGAEPDSALEQLIK